MASELKPCICGKTPRLGIKKGSAGITKTPFYREQIVCRCGVSSKIFKAPGKAVEAWNTRPTPVAPVSPDATGTVQTFNQIIDYVMRYGGRCRDCADEDGICPTNGTPCEPKVKRAVIEHTLKSLEYGLSHGFIENPFSIPKPDATGKCGELVTVRYEIVETLPSGVNRWQCVEHECHANIVASATEFPSVVNALCHCSQAVELLAAERADKRIWMEKAAVEAERVERLEADNAAQTARVKEWEKADRLVAAALWEKKVEALEAKLAAAEEVAQLVIQAEEDKSGDPNLYILLMQTAYDKARAALGGEPS